MLPEMDGMNPNLEVLFLGVAHCTCFSAMPFGTVVRMCHFKCVFEGPRGTWALGVSARENYSG
jgi:hypothetical protein